jgi:cholesterol transport system auxiliary component
MIVLEPVAIAPYDSERIVVRTGPEAVAYLKGAQWVERLPRLLQTTMIQSFENARLLRSVGRPGERFVADVSLTSEIRRFEIDVTTNEAIVEISARVVAEGSGRIIAARIFSARVPGSAADGKAASAALDAAADRVLREIVAWSAGR